MNEARALHQRLGAVPGTAILLLIGFVLFCGCDREEISVVARPDILVIDGMSVFGDLERPVVFFPHDLHTAALAADGKSCGRCHFEDDGGMLLPEFKRKGDGERDALMNLYHDECIVCHQERADDTLSTGPVVCGECHREDPVFASSRMLIGFDHSLHGRHVKACGDECVTCHRVYEEDQKPSSCRDCHGAKTVDRRPSMRAISHERCLGCHIRKEAEEVATGPLDCAGCHDAARVAAVKFFADAPRLDANQPDITLLQPGKGDAGTARMSTVIFDHKAHEAACTNCRACHHESLRACRECHTMAGSTEGGGVTLEAAMHNPASEHSCLGCHGAKKAGSQCAGCHETIEKETLPEDSCSFCHNGPPPGAEAKEIRLPAAGGRGFSLADSEIPETITIDRLSTRFGPANFPHRKIIEILRAGAAESGVAAHFHGGEDTLCAGCHHNSPAGERPPLCGSCHGKPCDERAIHMPGLIGAYHLQCMGCHVEMKLDNLLSCTACHTAKASETGNTLPAAKEEQ
jgi:hypothetical protein